MEKEFLYVGHYYDINNNYILKIGTTNDLNRRQQEHTRNYKKPSSSFQMPKNGKFEYDFSIPLSKYNTLRFEDRNREAWKNAGVGEFVRNDRFYCAVKPERVEITIRKTYIVELG